MTSLIHEKKTSPSITNALLASPIVLTLFYYEGYKGILFPQLFPHLQGHEIYGVYRFAFQFVFFFVLCFLVPFASEKWITGRKLSEFGFKLGDVKFGLKSTFLLIPFLIVPLLLIGSHMPDVRSEYPLAKELLTHHEHIFWYEFVNVLFYYFAWEFYFRGYLLQILRPTFGDWNAILIQTIPSCLIHLGKPQGETLGAIFAGVAWGWIAIRTDSFIYVWIMHSFVGVVTDLLVIYTG